MAVESDTVFFSLPGPIQRRIDRAFQKTLESISTPKATDSGAGFVVDDDDAPTSEISLHAQIPLELVPQALQDLDFPPDDDQVLSVFRNAAEGWKTDGKELPSSQSSNPTSLGVSLEDWRSVCAVLLENDDNGNDSEEGGIGKGAGGDHDDVDVYMQGSDESDGGDEDDPDDEDFDLGPRLRRKRGRTTGANVPSSLAAEPIVSGPNTDKLSDDQKRAALDSYALFFPEIHSDNLQSQKIMIKDIQRVAELLKEKLKAEEIMDMLEMFSTSPDKSVSFGDFTRMLTTAKLV